MSELMRSAITLGLGIWMAAAAPGLCAQVNASTPNSVKSALGAGTPAQQAAKPATPAAPKPAPQTAKPARKPAGKTAGEQAGKRPAQLAVQENSNEDELAGLSAWLPDACELGAGGEPSARSDAGARWRNGDRSGYIQRRHYPSAATLGGARRRRGTSRGARRPDAKPGSPGTGFGGPP